MIYDIYVIYDIYHMKYDIEILRKYIEGVAGTGANCLWYLHEKDGLIFFKTLAYSMFEISF